MPTGAEARIEKTEIGVLVDDHRAGRGTATGQEGTPQWAIEFATVDELQDIDYREQTHMRPVRHHLGITAFGTNRGPLREWAIG